MICNLGCEEEVGETKRWALHWWPLAMGGTWNNSKEFKSVTECINQTGIGEIIGASYSLALDTNWRAGAS